VDKYDRYFGTRCDAGCVEESRLSDLAAILVQGIKWSDASMDLRFPFDDICISFREERLRYESKMIKVRMMITGIGSIS
jgi:hypothetical protein